MKIAIGYNIIKGPWGGGNRFAIDLNDALVGLGHTVKFDLKDKDIDIILLTDPRAFSPSVSFSTGAVLRYLLFTNPQSIVVHRVNECDERKNTNHMNKALLRANWCADHTIFVGTWLTELSSWKNNFNNNYSVILNGSNKEIFDNSNRLKWNEKEPLKLVTHHWGGNLMKGFDIYSKIDQMLDVDKWKKLIDFTYIGNLPNGFNFKNVNYIKPMNGKKLANAIKKNHIYVTASINEPGGNHQNEAGLCGLPILYRNSGCLPEYCEGYGIQFDRSDFEESLMKMINNYNFYFKKVKNYPHSSDKTSLSYIQLFESLLLKKKKYSSNRRFWNSPIKLLSYILSF